MRQWKEFTYINGCYMSLYLTPTKKRRRKKKGGGWREKKKKGYQDRMRISQMVFTLKENKSVTVGLFFCSLQTHQLLPLNMYQSHKSIQHMMLEKYVTTIKWANIC